MYWLFSTVALAWLAGATTFLLIGELSAQAYLFIGIIPGVVLLIYGEIRLLR